MSLQLPFGLSHEQVDELDPMTCILYADLIVDACLSDHANDLLCKVRGCWRCDPSCILPFDSSHTALGEESQRSPWMGRNQEPSVVQWNVCPPRLSLILYLITRL